MSDGLRGGVDTYKKKRVAKQSCGEAQADPAQNIQAVYCHVGVDHAVVLREESVGVDLSEFVAHFSFSSRIRHTRWNCDWSSDVCSSDLQRPIGPNKMVVAAAAPTRRPAFWPYSR